MCGGEREATIPTSPPAGLMQHPRTAGVLVCAGLSGEFLAAREASVLGMVSGKISALYFPELPSPWAEGTGGVTALRML